MNEHRRLSFIERATACHEGFYSYDKVEYPVGDNGKVEIVCPKHGSFWQSPRSHLQGHGCLKCGREKFSKSSRMCRDEFIAKSRSIHGDKYDYSKAYLSVTRDKVTIVCPDHGEFQQRAGNHILGSGCRKCAHVKMKKEFIRDKDGFLILAEEIHGKFYPSEYIGALQKIIIECPKHGEFAQTPDSHINAECSCPACSNRRSKPEQEIFDFISSLGVDAIRQYPIPGDHRSYDIYVPNHKLAIEHHGLIWHSERFRSGMVDREKYELACQRGDRLIQIYSDEWINKKDIFKSLLISILKPSHGKRVKPEYRIAYGTPVGDRTFLHQNHYLGSASGCITIEAWYKSKLIGVWVFMKRDTTTVLWHRACWDHEYRTWHPHEHALKLAIPALKSIGFKRILTFSDNRLHTGALYTDLGFSFETEIPPEYSYTRQQERKSKFSFRVPAGIDEVQEAAKLGWYRIWDSGKKRFSLEI